jgi:hypothetical protein
LLGVVVWALDLDRSERQAKLSGLSLQLLLSNGGETGEGRV